MSNESKSNRIMVVGSGVAGINAALELAERGYPVSLVETSSALGGMVPRLHRLYPVCSCCKLGDRLTLAEDHPNIQVLSDSEIQQVTGNTGNFAVTVQSPGGQQQLSVGSVILAMGVEAFDPSAYDTYSYSSYANVVTSLELEWLQKPNGEHRGLVKRPSDGQSPKRVAWIQCVGSRDINTCDANYCSSVCCMYALKEAVNLLEQSPEVSTDIYFMDIRTHGKGYEEFLNSAQQKGVRLIRSRVHTIERVAESDDLAIRYMPFDGDGGLSEEIYDMVVLSVGLRPSASVAKVAEQLGVELADDGFVHTTSLKPVETSIPGVYVCGGASGPEDVHDSLVQAIAAAAKVGEGAQPELPQSSFPALKDVSQESARIGIVFAGCPNKSSDFDSLVQAADEYASKLPNLVATKTMKVGDSGAGEQLADFIQTEQINRIIFASCSPQMHKEVVESALRRAGLNPYLYDLVDLRMMGAANADQLKEQLQSSALKLQLFEPPNLVEIEVPKRVVVVGGGLAGMESALALAAKQVSVTLVEKKPQLGGHALNVRTTWQGESVNAYVKKLIDQVQNNKLITVLTGASVIEKQGFEGNFTTKIEQNGAIHEIAHGAVVFATGGHAIQPTEYLYGANPNVYTWNELSERLLNDPQSLAKAANAVFIQCVGSREPQRPYCSRICCTFAVSSALALKDLNPDMNIYILYRDMRTFGKREDLYKEARRKGIIFVRFDVTNKPVVSERDGKLVVSVTDPILEREIQLQPDFISLQSAIEPNDNQKLSEIFEVERDSFGFFRESPSKMKPVDSDIPGAFVAGLAVAPKATEQNLAEGVAAAGRALNVLSKDKILVGGFVANVNTDLCAACLVCVRSCPFQVPYIQAQEQASFKGAAYIDPGKCQGCGVCVSECPAKAISMTGPSDAQILAMTKSFFKAV